VYKRTMVAALSYEQLSKELMRHLRGDESQRQFSRALGFSSNVVYTWESGRRFPEASAFFKAAKLCQPPFSSRFARLLRDQSRPLGRIDPSTPRGVHRLVQYLTHGAAQGELAYRIGVDRTTMSRWVHGKTEPRLPEWLRLFEVTTQQLLQMLSLLVDPEQLPSTRDAYVDLRLQQRLAYDLPWSHAILRALELDAYRARPTHEPGFLAARIGLDADREGPLLRELADAGQIGWNGTHWVSCRVMSVDTRQDPERNRALKAHWAQVGLERLSRGDTSSDALFSFNLFAISEGSFQKLRQLHLEYYDRVRALIDESPGTDRVVLMNLQLLPLAATSGPGD